MTVLHVDDSNFNTEVLQSVLPVLVDFGATWCGPCQKQIPVVERFANAHSDKFKTCSIDIDDAPQAAAKFGIRSLPSLVLFYQGQKIDLKIGLTNFNQLESFCLSKLEQK